MKKQEILDISYLKNNAQVIQYFGLGFIQIKLNDFERVHVYTKELPAIIDIEDIHNHRYSFTSYILSGSFVQEIFEIVEGDTYVLRNESCSEGNNLENKGETCGIRFNNKHIYKKGDQYTVDKDTFHRVFSHDAITYLVREKPSKEFAQVVTKQDSPHVCPFSKKVPENELWSIVEKSLKKANTTQNTF
jgi:hypothetical protein